MAGTVQAWRDRFGVASVRTCRNHAKIARVWNARARVVIRGSMNFNANPRFEQADITEGGPEFDLLAGIEATIPILRPFASAVEADRASRCTAAFDASELAMLHGLKPWAK